MLIEKKNKKDLLICIYLYNLLSFVLIDKVSLFVFKLKFLLLLICGLKFRQKEDIINEVLEILKILVQLCKF